MVKREPSRVDATITVATLAAALMIAEQVAGKASRDGFFLTQFPATELPKAMMAAAILSVLGSVAYTGVLRRLSPARAVPATFAASAALFLLEWLLAASAPRPTAVLLYLHMAVLGLLVISGFWVLVNENLDPHAAKTAIGRILAGATLGGVLGGVLADRITATLGLRSMLVALGAMHLLCTLILRRLPAPAVRVVQDEPGTSVVLGLRVLRHTPYLQHMAIVVALSSMIAAWLDYLFKARAAASIGNPDSLVSFFAAFYTITGLLTFLVQRTLSGGALRRFGVGAAMASLPAALLGMSVLGVVAARAWLLVTLRGTESVLGNAFFRPGLEVLYTPLPAEKKRATKAIVDVAFQRVGDLVGGGLIVLWLSLWPGRSASSLLVAVALAAGAALVMVRRLYRGYIEQLGESLRRGLVTLDSADVIDATTARTLAFSRNALDRDEFLAQIRRYRDRQIGLAVPGWTRPEDECAPTTPSPSDQLLGESIALLLGDDRVAAAQALARRPVDPRLAALAITRLADAELSSPARAALEEIAPRVVGQLIDALVDDSLSVFVRRHIPAILERGGGVRTRDGLLLALRVAPFEVRYHAAQSLARLVASVPELAPPPAEVFALVRRELEVPKDEWAAHQVVEADGVSSFLEDTVRRRLERGLEHVFTLLSVVLPAEPLGLALRGLLTGDVALRGTSLEYLENVVPEVIRQPLWRRLGATMSGTARRRSQREIEADLIRTRHLLP